MAFIQYEYDSCGIFKDNISPWRIWKTTHKSLQYECSVFHISLDSIVTGNIENTGRQMSNYKIYRVEKFNNGLIGAVQFNEKIIEELLQFTEVPE